MKLTDRNPRWFRFGDAPEGAKQGVTFDCPCCTTTRLGAWFDVPICGSPAVDFKAVSQACMTYDHPDYPELHETHHSTQIYWHREGDSFETLTLTPSIDASGFGHWHGFITNGEIR